MKATHLLTGCLILTVVLGCESPAAAQTPPAKPPATLWQFLGIPQAFRRSYDGLMNRRGERPNLERKPPLKALADPANLQSDNPAIKAAAEIKQQEDLKPQKVKAIKYLAEIACGCYPGVKEALLAALDDCTEDVRYEAAVAFCKAAGSPCSLCNRATCCDAKVKEKLKDMAQGTDANGCCKEPSARVRAAAAMALRACNQIPTAAPAEKKEGPTETEKKETGEGVLRGGQAPMPRAPSPAAPSANKTSSIFSPVSLPSSNESAPSDAPGVLPGGNAGYADNAGYAAVEHSGVRGIPCQCARCRRWSGRVVCPAAPAAPGIAGAAPSAPGTEEPGAAPPSPAPTALAGTFGAARAPASAAPYMIGDMFGGSGSMSSIVQGFSFSGLSYNCAAGYTIRDQQTRVARHNPCASPGQLPIDNTTGRPLVDIVDYNDASARLGGNPLNEVPAGGALVSGTTSPDFPNEGPVTWTSAFDVQYFVPVINPGSGGVVGKLKIADNTSPMPRDRLIFDYSYFDNVPLYPGGVNVNRFVLGFEKTFCQGAASFELKAPMASTLDSDLTIGEAPGLTEGEFGDMLLTFKGLLIETETMAFSAGVSVGVPTADSTRVGMIGRPTLIEIENESTHVAPFLGWLWTPNDCFFAHAFLQYDVDTNGNPVLVNEGNGLADAGRLTDSTFQYVDVGIGRWIYRNEGRPGGIQGVAWTAELHWNLALQDADYIRSGNFLIGQPLDSVENFSAVVGAHIQTEKSILTVGYGTPLGGGADQEFDGELRVMFNRNFGRTTRFSQTPSML